jgi:hypothetical protein
MIGERLRLMWRRPANERALQGRADTDPIPGVSASLLVGIFFHSTVTLFARLRGLSTSVPRARAT